MNSIAFVVSYVRKWTDYAKLYHDTNMVSLKDALTIRSLTMFNGVKKVDISMALNRPIVLTWRWVNSTFDSSYAVSDPEKTDGVDEPTQDADGKIITNVFKMSIMHPHKQTDIVAYGSRSDTEMCITFHDLPKPPDETPISQVPIPADVVTAIHVLTKYNIAYNFAIPVQYSSSMHSMGYEYYETYYIKNFSSLIEESIVPWDDKYSANLWWRIPLRGKKREANDEQSGKKQRIDVPKAINRIQFGDFKTVSRHGDVTSYQLKTGETVNKKNLYDDILTLWKTVGQSWSISSVYQSELLEAFGGKTVGTQTVLSMPSDSIENWKQYVTIPDALLCTQGDCMYYIYTKTGALFKLYSADGMNFIHTDGTDVSFWSDLKSKFDQEGLEKYTIIVTGAPYKGKDVQFVWYSSVPLAEIMPASFAKVGRDLIPNINKMNEALETFVDSDTVDTVASTYEDVIEWDMQNELDPNKMYQAPVYPSNYKLLQQKGFENRIHVWAPEWNNELFEVLHDAVAEQYNGGDVFRPAVFGAFYVFKNFIPLNGYPIDTVETIDRDKKMVEQHNVYDIVENKQYRVFDTNRIVYYSALLFAEFYNENGKPVVLKRDLYLKSDGKTNYDVTVNKIDWFQLKPH